MSGSRIDENLHGLRRGDLDDVRKLEMSYSQARPEKIHLSVEYVGGRIKVFGTQVLELDRYLIERLLDQARFPRRPLSGNLVNTGSSAPVLLGDATEESPINGVLGNSLGARAKKKAGA